MRRVFHLWVTIAAIPAVAAAADLTVGDRLVIQRLDSMVAVDDGRISGIGTDSLAWCHAGSVPLLPDPTSPFPCNLTGHDAVEVGRALSTERIQDGKRQILKFGNGSLCVPHDRRSYYVCQ